MSPLQGYVTEELHFSCIVEHKICFKIDFSKINEFKIQNRVKKNKLVHLEVSKSGACSVKGLREIPTF